MFMLIW